MSKIIFNMKRPKDLEYVTASVVQLEFPMADSNKSEIYLNFSNKFAKNHQIFIFNMMICGKNKSDVMLSIDDVSSITLLQNYETCTKYDVIEKNYEYWANILTKRLEEIKQLRADRFNMLEKLDQDEDDVSIKDIDLVTQQIKNYTNEVNNICEQQNDIEYKDIIEKKYIDLICGKMKRVRIKEDYCTEPNQKTPIEELYDVVWCIQDYEDKSSVDSKRVETISSNSHMITVSKIRKQKNQINQKR